MLGVVTSINTFRVTYDVRVDEESSTGEEVREAFEKSLERLRSCSRNAIPSCYNLFRYAVPPLSSNDSSLVQVRALISL